MQLRKVAAVALGALMAGVSVAGAALAADYTLSDFPAPFVENGTPNFIIVIGSAGTASGIASDMVGAIDIAARLGGETVTTTGGTSGTTVSGGVQVKTAGDDLNYGEHIADIISTGFSDTDFPTLLKKGTYTDSKGTNKNTETYTQEIDFKPPGSGSTPESALVTFDTNDNLDDKPAGTYLYFPSGKVIYTYTLEFTNPIDVADENDIKSTKIEILGKTYSISGATVSGGSVTELTLLGGASEQTVNDETPVTVTVNGVDYTVTPSIYGADSVVFTVSYNGNTETTDEMGEDDTYELADGTEIGVKDILFSTKESKTSAVTFYVGAQKITLSNTDGIKINDEDIDNYDTTVTIDSSSNELSSISFSVAPSDDMWIGVGEEWTDPVFGAWKVMFPGIEKKTEEISATASGNDGTLTVKDIAGNELSLPFVVDETNDVAAPGDDVDNSYTVTVDGHNSPGNMMIHDGDKCTGSSSVTDCEGTYFLAVNSGGEARIIEIKDIDTTHHQIDFKDKTTGTTFSDKAYTDGTATDIKLGSFMTIRVLVNETAKSITMTNINDFSGDAANSDFKTSLSGEVGLAFDGTNTVVTLYDDDGANLFSFNYNVDNDDMAIDTSTSGLYREKDGSDYYEGIDGQNWGALLKWDSKDKDDLTIEYPEEQAIADVYVAPVGATMTTSTGEVTRSGVIKTSIATVDTDVTTAQKTNNNIILVGGPCVNKLTAEALGMDFPTCGSASGIPENGYMIKLVKDAFATGKYALVIAGWEAENTQAACAKVQADMAGLTGTEYYYPAAPTA
ncbi:MAG: S-layer protein [Candidatus Aenigmarchaeota archaeon]|nr:S-layer protein [Candidatus Aenigmarchaeota archaeon]